MRTIIAPAKTAEKQAEQGACVNRKGVYNEVNVVPMPRVPFGKRHTEAVRKSDAVMRRLYAVLTATAVAEAVDTHINITTLDTVGTERTAHLIFVAGVY